MWEMTVQDMDGHWRSKDGRYHIWIRANEGRVQMYEEGNPIIDEPIAFEYKKLENEITISPSVDLFMIQPRDESVFLRFGDNIVFEFMQVYR